MFKKNKDGLYHINGSFSIDEIACFLKENAATYFRGEKQTVTNPNAMKLYLMSVMSHHKSEVFGVVFVDNRHRVQAFEIMFYGTVDGASVHPREIVRRSIHHNSAAVVFAHNHPSGVQDPSQADIALTSRLKDALGLIDVRVLDHFIIGEESPVSMSERGLL